MTQTWKDSHIPNDRKRHEEAPLPQSHRRALGLPVDGMKDPYGAESGDKTNKVGNGTNGKTW